MAPGIVIVGLGPGAVEHLTLEAWSVLSQTRELYLRTSQHPTVAGLPGTVVCRSFDDVYDTEASFADVYRVIAERVLKLAQRPEGVVYAVPGHPLVGESTVQAILAGAREAGLAVRIVNGLSFLEPVLAALGLDPLAEGIQVVDAMALIPTEPFAPASLPVATRPLIVAQVYGARVASQAKLTLLEVYPPEHEVVLVRAAGVADVESLVRMPLYRLDRQVGLDPLTTLYVPPLPPEADVSNLPGFQRIIARLRAPDGCPWDREQTHASLKKNLLEESYEVLAALDAEDPAKLCEELGDLLLQIVLHAQIAVEEDEFALADVIRGISEKIVRRHPHVFADTQVADTGELLRNWERIKQDERDANHENGVHERSLLAGVPPELPALAASQAIQERASRVGFDWEHLAGVLEHLAEELREVAEAGDQNERLGEFGDVLFAVANAGRWMQVDAEEALRLANSRFRRRFQAMEALCRERGLDFAALPMPEKDALWDETKLLERTDGAPGTAGQDANHG